MDNEDLDELESLDILFEDLSIEGYTKDQMYEAYGIYLKNIAKSNLSFRGLKVNVNRKPSTHYLCKGKHQCFEHIITRENKYKERKKRDFDHQRANRFHWIPIIIKHHNDPRIKCFEEVNNDGENQIFFWYEEKDFLVIIREIHPSYLLITGFYVDQHEKNTYRTMYKKYRA